MEVETCGVNVFPGGSASVFIRVFLEKSLVLYPFLRIGKM
jgi:hypothetical protein